MHHFMCLQNEAFAWQDSERGSFRTDFFPPVDIPVMPHTPWVQRNIPIPPGIYDQVCKLIRTKIDAGVDGTSLRIVHALEPLNAVTIQHSGVTPFTDQIAEHFAGRACGAMLDLYVGYDERLLAPSSRDYTTFQTPYGALRLVTLPMGWTNSVPIFHDDVTFILQPEIPNFTIPYIDDVACRGPASRYQSEDGSYETIPENTGIRRFVWEHFNNLNRIVQRMKYCGGTFSGFKSVLCAENITVVGHLCTPAGRIPDEKRVAKIVNWGPCKDLSEVRAFLGTIGVVRIFIRNFAHRAHSLTMLTRKDMPFLFGPAQISAQEDLKHALVHSPALRPIDYSSHAPAVLGVDTSYLAVGHSLSQCDPNDLSRRYYARFGSITLNAREARFSQPKLELYGLFRALRAWKMYLIGVRNLVVEVDARYIKGMLAHPDLEPSASINRWILAILTFHFTLVHVPGVLHGPDGLSRRPPSARR
ncbi:DNA/RNA polymerase [Mycena venus]|uniref:DNA/RNA polymerase n=1 Tax=Mycena venus TaxID=2733690 RepID=A0A8H6XQY9_9AGAR|nr:DNA/RNA polymerase [Mycena venus]